MTTHLQKIDAYLLQTISTGFSEGWEAVGPEASMESTRLPVLVRVEDIEEWTPPEGFEVQARMGNIVSGRVLIRSLEGLDIDPNVLSIEASRDAGIAECAKSVPFIKANIVHQPTWSEQGERCLVAFIDTGIDVHHESFLDDQGHSRIIEIWDQRDNTGPAPNVLYPNLELNYGTVHTADAINHEILTGPTPDNPYAPSIGSDHGTHVASIAAGRAAGDFAGGVAPAAKILFVIPMMRTAPTDQFSIGYSSSHQEALTYIKEVARTRNLPVVVNVSLGMNAGAHDGTSLLEAGFDVFSGGGRAPGLVIVKSAGNERGLGGHAKLTMGSQRLEELIWESSDELRNEDLIELWFKATDEFHFTLRSPSAFSTNTVNWAAPITEGFFNKSGNAYKLHYTRYHQDNGDSRLLVTIRRGQGLRIEPGIWTLAIETGQVRSSGEVHAWLERDDSRAIRFTNHENEEMTLSIPGTAHSVITVGAVNSNFPMRNHPNSSYGPTRDSRQKPDVVAPGIDVHAAQAGTLTGAIAKNGTSMAAPHVTGAIALLLSRREKQGWASRPSAAQVRAALTQLTQQYTGHFTPSAGYGVLDVEALLAAFE